MFDIQAQLFEGKDIRLGPIDYEKDPEIESKWTHDSGFMRMYETQPARPMSVTMVKKGYEKIEKEAAESKGMYYFAIRGREDDRLIGKAVVEDIDWSNSYCFIKFGIGAPDDRRKRYGTQTVRMLIRFIFGELNLYRIGAIVPEYNEVAINLLQKFGFVEEVRRRQAMDRDGRRWDMLIYGLLRDEWKDQSQE